MQLDIFEHGRDTMLRNDVAQALARCDTACAASALQALAQAYPTDETLAPAQVLLDALRADIDIRLADHACAKTARLWLTQSVEPAALRIFGERDAAVWLAPFWRALAQRAARLDFDPAHSDDHAAAYWLLCGDAAAARDAVQGIASWRRIPLPLAWMAQARYALDGLDATWPLLAELAWLSPALFERVTKRLADPLLSRLIRQFGAMFEAPADNLGEAARDLAWFPAWVLTQQASLSHRLGPAEPGQHTPPEQAMRALLGLIDLERQARHHDLVARRKGFMQAHPALYAAYMATR
jgi:hypothetical protein